MFKMKIPTNIAKLYPFFQKYRYVFLILFVGICILCFGATDDVKEQDTELTQISSQFDLDEFTLSLENQLSCIQNAGEVSLLLTVEDTEEVVYASDVRKSTSGQESATYENSLSILSDSSYGEAPVKVKSISPTFRGAVVLCEGANDINVRLAVTQAVSAACGLSMDKISVLTMDTTQKQEDMS